MLHRIAARVLNRPLLLLPHTAEIICSVLAERIGVEPMTFLEKREKPKSTRFTGESVVSNMGVLYARSGSTGIVTVEGEMVNRGAWIGADSGLTSYEGIDAQLRAAASDPKVKQILLDVESPGGEAVGAFELAATVRKIASEKPVHAIANGMAASAAYSMVSGATRIYTTPSAMSGSIGVVLLHLDQSGKIAKAGIKPTLIFAGAHKVDGHPFGPLPESVSDDLQAEVNQFYQLFIETVAAGRTGMTEQSIRSTEARTFVGADAVKTGLADDVASFDDVLHEITRAAKRSTPVGKGASMTDNKSASAAEQAEITKTDLDKAVADAVASGAKAAQDRIAAIMALDAAKGRATLANHIAFKTAMSVDEAKAMLEASALEGGGKVLSIEERSRLNAGAGHNPETSAPHKLRVDIVADMARRAGVKV